MSYSKLSPQLQELVRTMICIHMQENDALISASDVQSILSAVSVLEDIPGTADIGKAAQAEEPKAEAKPELELPEDMPEEIKTLIRSLTAQHPDAEIHVHEITRETVTETSEEKPSVFEQLKALHKSGAGIKEGVEFLKSVGGDNPAELLPQLLAGLKADLLKGMKPDHEPHFVLDRTCNGPFGEVRVYQDTKALDEYQIVHKDRARDIKMKPGHTFDLTYLRCVEMCRSSTVKPHCIIE